MRTTFALLTLFGAILVGGYVFAEHQMMLVRDSVGAIAAPAPAHVDASDTKSAANASSARASSTTTASSGASYTAKQVAAHSTSQSCWTSIHGSVYDLTAWISQHPGGPERILSICGKDGTQAFETQHGSAGDTRPKQMLATFEIGTLVP